MFTQAECSRMLLHRNPKVHPVVREFRRHTDQRSASEYISSAFDSYIYAKPQT